MRQEESRPCRSNVSACSRFRDEAETLYLQSANKRTLTSITLLLNPNFSFFAQLLLTCVIHLHVL